jgi:hypothetical protein
MEMTLEGRHAGPEAAAATERESAQKVPRRTATLRTVARLLVFRDDRPGFSA